MAKAEKIDDQFGIRPYGKALERGIDEVSKFLDAAFIKIKKDFFIERELWDKMRQH